jgi:hypothetical protein
MHQETKHDKNRVRKAGEEGEVRARVRSEGKRIKLIGGVVGGVWVD